FPLGETWGSEIRWIFIRSSNVIGRLACASPHPASSVRTSSSLISILIESPGKSPRRGHGARAGRPPPSAIRGMIGMGPGGILRRTSKDQVLPAGAKRHFLALPIEPAAKLGGQRDVCGEMFALARVAECDLAPRMRQRSLDV